jgi:hypothetical protein
MDRRKLFADSSPSTAYVLTTRFPDGHVTLENDPGPDMPEDGSRPHSRPRQRLRPQLNVDLEEQAHNPRLKRQARARGRREREERIRELEAVVDVILMQRREIKAVKAKQKKSKKDWQNERHWHRKIGGGTGVMGWAGMDST